MQDYIVGFLDGYKSVKLYYKFYPAGDAAVRIIFLHGAGEYSEKYSRFAEWFSARGVDVYLLDLRGHGRSAGPVCHVNDFNDYALDLDIFVRFIEKGWGDKKTFLAAPSLGGLIAMFYSLKFSYAFKGIIACSPCLGLRLKIEPVKAWLADIFNKILADKPFSSNIRPSMATHDRYIIEKFGKDPLIHHMVTASFYVQMKKAMRYLMEHAADLKSRIFILQAQDDKICDVKVVEKFYNLIGSNDKKFRLYPGFYHELLNEVKREEPYNDIYNWITV